MTTAKVIDNYSIFVTLYGGSSVGWVIITFYHGRLQNKQHHDITIIYQSKSLIYVVLN